jgi:hypothetical protein
VGNNEIPDHSVLSKARKRWGREVFLSLFSPVVQQCVEAGLVAGSKIHVDASLVDGPFRHDPSTVTSLNGRLWPGRSHGARSLLAVWGDAVWVCCRVDVRVSRFGGWAHRTTMGVAPVTPSTVTSTVATPGCRAVRIPWGSTVTTRGSLVA